MLVSDVMGHVYRRVPESAQADWAQEQTPAYQVSGNFPVALLLGGQGWSKGRAAPDPLEAAPAARPPAVPHIDTGGGAYIGGNVRVGRDFIGRDQVRITGDGNVVGDHSSATVVKTTGLDAAQAAALFARVYAAIVDHPGMSPQEKQDLQAEVQEVQQETARGEEANESFLAHRLRNIERMAPDILDVVVATLLNPVAGIAAAARKVAQRIKEQSGAQADPAGGRP